MTGNLPSTRRGFWKHLVAAACGLVLVGSLGCDRPDVVVPKGTSPKKFPPKPGQKPNRPTR